MTLHYLCTSQLSEASYKKKMNAHCWHKSRDEGCKMDESFSGDKRARVQNIACILPFTMQARRKHLKGGKANKV